MLSAEANIELYSLEESISVPDCTTRIEQVRKQVALYMGHRDLLITDLL